MENFRPGVMDKLGIGYEALSAINPRLIYCCIRGFGQTGPARLGAGYDGKIQAMSGIMSITGHEETGPTRAGFAVCDVLSGATAAFGVSSALFQRTHTGKGQLVDVSMLEATLAFLSGQVADYTVAGHQQLSGNQAVSRRPTANLFKAGDGYLLLAVNNEKQYTSLMKALGREDVLSDPRFADWFLRNENEPALRKIIEDVLATKDPRSGRRSSTPPARPAPTSGGSRRSSIIRRSKPATPSRRSTRPMARCASPAPASSWPMAAASSTAWRPPERAHRRGAGRDGYSGIRRVGRIVQPCTDRTVPPSEGRRWGVMWVLTTSTRKPVRSA